MSEKLTIYFDGGCRPTNPGRKYGSFEVLLNGKHVFARRKFELGWGTNNEAEFEALLTALRETASQLALAAGINPKGYYINAVTDSKIVRNRICRKFQSTKNEAGQRMAALTQKCLDAAAQFGGFKVSWKGRAENVRRFGH